MFASVGRFHDRVAALKGQLTGELRIAVVDNSTMSPSTRIPQVIHRFARENTHVHVALEVLSNAEIEAALLTGKVHLGVGVLENKNPGLVELQRFPVLFDLYCGAQHPLFNQRDIEPEDVAEHAFAECKYGLHRSAGLGLQGEVAASSQLSEGLAFLILSGRYLGYLPRRYAATWVTVGEMRALPEALFSRDQDLSLMARKGERDSPTLALFLQHFEQFGAGLSD